MIVNANTEIERKFLVKGDFRPWVYSSTRIVQGYIVAGSGKTVRVRIYGDKAFLTIKCAGSNISHFEWEKEITIEDAEILMKQCEPGMIDKVRHLVRNADGIHTWEVDEFYGDNEGLIIAEIELASETDSFDRPEWIGEEVSGDRRYYNSMLSRHPFKDWE